MGYAQQKFLNGTTQSFENTYVLCRYPTVIPNADQLPTKERGGTWWLPTDIRGPNQENTGERRKGKLKQDVRREGTRKPGHCRQPLMRLKRAIPS